MRRPRRRRPAAPAAAGGPAPADPPQDGIDAARRALVFLRFPRQFHRVVDDGPRRDAIEVQRAGRRSAGGCRGPPGRSRETRPPAEGLDDRVERAQPPQRAGRDVRGERLVARVVEPLAGARQRVGKVGPARRRPRAARRRPPGVPAPAGVMCRTARPAGSARRPRTRGPRARVGLRPAAAAGRSAAPVSRLDDEAVAADGEHLAGPGLARGSRRASARATSAAR